MFDLEFKAFQGRLLVAHSEYIISLVRTTDMVDTLCKTTLGSFYYAWCCRSTNNLDRTAIADCRACLEVASKSWVEQVYPKALQSQIVLSLVSVTSRLL